MRGSLKQRYPGSWYAIIELDRERDPKTGLVKRRKKWIRVGRTRREAERKLNELLRDVQRGEFVEPDKTTLREWLPRWLELKTKIGVNTRTKYHDIIEDYILKSDILADVPIQKLRPSHLEQYYRTLTALSASTCTVHHTILRQALKKAVRDKLLTANPAVDLGDDKPKRTRDRSEDAQQHCWTKAETRAFLAVTQKESPQWAAFYAFALDSGARKGEICGLRWQDVNLDEGAVLIAQQLLRPAGEKSLFGPPKGKRTRTIQISAETVDLLKVHKKHQAAVKMKNRTAYHDGGLVFAKEWADARSRQDSLGHPLQANNLGQREYLTFIKAANVKRIKFHGLRHTCATLLLAAREPVHAVAQRLGHADETETLRTYAHVLPDMKREQATKIGGILFG